MSDGTFMCKAVQAMSGESDFIEEVERKLSENVEQKSYLECANYQRRNAMNLIADGDKIGGIKDYIHAMLNYLISIVEDTSYSDDLTRQKCVSQAAGYVKGSNINIDAILDVVQNSLKEPILDSDKNVMRRASMMYKEVCNRKNDLSIRNEWVSAAKNACCIGDKLRSQIKL